MMHGQGRWLYRMAQSRKLQVFISSTYIDLQEERQAAVEAVLTAGHIPAGMELFTAGDESQMNVIKRWIDESDVYLLILGGRYGSIEPNSQKSYIQLEYEYAVAKGKPLFAVVIEDANIEERVKRHGIEFIEREHPQRLREFRSMVLSRMVRFWRDPRDIKLAILETLSEFSRREDLIGWVPGTEAIHGRTLTEEVARLSQENAELRERSPKSVLAFYPNWRDFNWKEQLADARRIEIIVSFWPQWVATYMEEIVKVFDRDGTVSLILPSPYMGEPLRETLKLFPDHSTESLKREIEKTAAALYMAFERSTAQKKRIEVYFYNGRLNYAAVRFDLRTLYYGFYEHFRELRIGSSACLLDLQSSPDLWEFWEKEFKGFVNVSRPASLAELQSLLTSMKSRDNNERQNI